MKSHQTGRVACGLAKFGLIPSWAKDEKIARHTYNARSETPIVGEFANDDQVRPMNFIPPYAEKLLELASAGKFPVPLNCEIHVGSEDWQSCANSKAFGALVGIKIHVVEGAGHMLPKPYVATLLDNLAKLVK